MPTGKNIYQQRSTMADLGSQKLQKLISQFRRSTNKFVEALYKLGSRKMSKSCKTKYNATNIVLFGTKL